MRLAAIGLLCVAYAQRSVAQADGQRAMTERERRLDSLDVEVAARQKSGVQLAAAVGKMISTLLDEKDAPAEASAAQKTGPARAQSQQVNSTGLARLAQLGPAVF